MTTDLAKFKDAYATMTVAVYEPLILQWISGWTLNTVATTVSSRLAKASLIARAEALSTAHAVSIAQTKSQVARLPAAAVLERAAKAARIVAEPPPTDRLGAQAVKVDGYPQAVAYRGVIYPSGLAADTFSARRAEADVAPASPIPTFVSGLAQTRPVDFDLRAAQKTVFSQMVAAAREPGAALSTALEKNLKSAGLFHFFPAYKIEEALSPIGIAHFYRQLYFNAEEGYGPIEQAFTVAPLETLEVVYENVRRQIHEEVLEVGLEQISETASEEKDTDEVSDKVSSMIQRDSSAAMSASTSGSIGVWQASASANASFKNSGQRSREQSSKRLKEVTTRAAERITKTFKLTTRDVQDITTTNLTRRIIRNDSPSPVAYGLRRVLRRVRVKVQDVGPRLVWQLYVSRPGQGLARSRFVLFREAAPIAVPDVPPGLPPRPAGGTDTGTTSSALGPYDGAHKCNFVTISIQPGADRKVTQVSIDSITDLEGGGKNDLAPSPINDRQWDAAWDDVHHSYTVKIGVLPGDAASVSVSYTYAWEPTGAVMDAWEAQRKAAVAAAKDQQLNEQFDRHKSLITERSKIRPRPAADLRKEERYEVMNRMVSHLFAHNNGGQQPSPLEIEYFHRYFDIDGMFTYTHPSWWRPRYTAVATDLRRPAYEITAESEPAPMGSSLGWAIQLDGDARRNEFLNSPWIRVCMPIFPGREREAIAWLAKHVEGEIGYDVNSGPLKDLLTQVEQYRDQEGKLGINGPDYVTIDSTVGDEPGDPAAPLKPENLYPIVQEYDVTVPTEGFVYDELKLI